MKARLNGVAVETSTGHGECSAEKWCILRPRPEACMRVATCWADGVGCPPGTPEDERDASHLVWLEKAAALGVADAQVKLGDRLRLEGAGTQFAGSRSGHELAAAWYRKVGR